MLLSSECSFNCQLKYRSSCFTLARFTVIITVIIVNNCPIIVSHHHFITRCFCVNFEFPPRGINKVYQDPYLTLMWVWTSYYVKYSTSFVFFLVQRDGTAVLENVSLGGAELPGCQGRLQNPGKHSTVTSWTSTAATLLLSLVAYLSIFHLILSSLHDDPCWVRPCPGSRLVPASVQCRVGGQRAPGNSNTKICGAPLSVWLGYRAWWPLLLPGCGWSLPHTGQSVISGSGYCWVLFACGWSTKFCVIQLEWSMKLWWPHCEALIAFLMAYSQTKKPELLKRFSQVYEYTMSNVSLHCCVSKAD